MVRAVVRDIVGFGVLVVEWDCMDLVALCCAGVWVMILIEGQLVGFVDVIEPVWVALRCDLVIGLVLWVLEVMKGAGPRLLVVLE